MEGSHIPESIWRQKALGVSGVSSDESDEETASAQEANKPQEPCADTKKDKRGSFWIEETQPIVNDHEPQVRNQRGALTIEEKNPTVAHPQASDQRGSFRIEEPTEATTKLPAPDHRQGHANDQNQEEERTSPLDTQLATLNSAFLEAVDAAVESDPESSLIPLLKDYLNFTRASVQGTSETPAVDFKELGNFFEQFDK